MGNRRCERRQQNREACDPGGEAAHLASACHGWRSNKVWHRGSMRSYYRLIDRRRDRAQAARYYAKQYRVHAKTTRRT
jgi:hypothetical protein